MEEIFKPIKGFEDKYLVSNYGRVKTVCTYHKQGERILKQYKHTGTDYVFVCLSKGYSKEKRKTMFKNYDVHRLVAETFLENPDNLPCVNHKDENPLNNHINNLEWCTPSYNANYGSRNKKLCKAVRKYDKTGSVVAEYDSIKEAAKSVNGYMGNISSCCRGILKTAYGFKWAYKS